MNSNAKDRPKTSQMLSSNEQQDIGVDIDVRGLLLMLWRRKMVVLSVMLIGLSLAVIILSFVQSRYTGRALVLIESAGQKSQTSKELQYIFSNMQFDASVILTEIEVIRSRTMARRVVERLNLMTDPEFNGRFKYDDTREAEGFKKLDVYRTQLESLPKEIVERELAAVTSNFLKNMNVRAVGGSNAIQIEFTSRSPNKAALITNTIADIYIEQRLDAKFKATKKLTDWLDMRLTDLREQVRQSEQAVVDYKEEFNLTEGTRSISSAEELTQLNGQLVNAKSKYAEAKARLDQVREVVRNKQNIESVSQIANSPLIQNLKRQEVALDGRYSELTLRYGAKHPELKKVKTELKDLRNSIQNEMNKIADTIENEVKFAEARVRTLEEGMAETQGQNHADGGAMIILNALTREAQSTQLIYDTFLETYKRSDAQEDLQEAEARIISYAIAASKPTFPNKLLLLSLSSAISLFIGLAIAVLLEKLDNSFRSANQLERNLKYPCYALIPYMNMKSQKSLADYIVSKPSSVLAESVRTLRTVINLRGANEGKKPRIVTITSSFPGEGKTTLSVWLGRLAAKSDEKVIIIDADLRRPNVHRAVGRSNDTTLVDYLTGQEELDEVIQKDDASGVHMIYGRSVPNSALDLISSDKMAKLVESLGKVYDLVIIDSPACLAVSDARVLASLSDHTVYSVGWDRTPREVVASGVKQFSDMGYDTMSFVLTKVDVKRHVKYGYGDTVYYYGRYKEYYSD